MFFSRVISIVVSLLILPAAYGAQFDLEIVEANAAKGFNFPYILRKPKELKPQKHTVLLVETNNSGSNDSFQHHLEMATKFAGNGGIGPVAAGKLNLPLLVPVFPRSETGWHIYTHALDRDTLTSEGTDISRLDVQLIHMIEDARTRLAQAGWVLRDKVVLCGFSASGTFANRMTMLHPNKVLAVVSGGINALAILPIEELGGHTLDYPLGIGDIDEFVVDSFDLEAWQRIPQYLFMGYEDTNDAVSYDDAYSQRERLIVHEVIGEEMGSRWRFVQKVYLENGSNSTFVTYGNVGHWTDTRIANDIANFIRVHALTGT